MKKQTKKEEPKLVLTKEVILRRNPMPFGDVRKYYLAAKVGTVVLLALLVYISYAAVLARTEFINQISNPAIVLLLLFSVAAIIGLYSRTICGYAIMAVSSLILLLILQYMNGTGVIYDAKSLSYGEYFTKGIQSMAFWVILAKVLSVLQFALAMVFICSTIKVTEEPPAVGMNEKIQKFREWLSKHNDSIKDGRRPLDYLYIGVSALLYILYFVGDGSMVTEDYFALTSFVIGVVLIVFRLTLLGAVFGCYSALIRCILYQFRFGWILSVIAAYLGLWVAILYMAFASAKKKRNTDMELVGRSAVLQDILMWLTVIIGIFSFSIHQVCGDFVHEFFYLSEVKDYLPVIFFVPIIAFLLIRSRQWYGYLCASVSYLGIWYVLHQIPKDSVESPLFDCEGMSQIHAENVLHTSVIIFKVLAIILCILMFVFGIETLIVKRNDRNAQ